jgi:hypothetical protein
VAIIPTYQERRGVQSEQAPVADINQQYYGADAHALNSFGGVASKIAENLIEARRKADESDAVFRQHQSDIIDYQNEKEKARQEFTVMDPVTKTVSFNDQGFSERLKQYGDERVKNGMEAMPTGDAQRAYRAASGSMFEQAYVENSSWENVYKEKVYRQNLGTELNGAAIQLQNQPDLFTLSKSLQSTGEWINNSPAAPLDGAQKADLFKEKGKELTYAYFNGLKKTRAGINQGLDILDNLKQVGGKSTVSYSADGKIQTYGLRFCRRQLIFGKLYRRKRCRGNQDRSS